MNETATSLNDSQSESHQLYINSNYSDQFFSELRALFVKKKFTDVVLICAPKPPTSTKEEENDADNETNCIACHKLVLSAFSPYFQAMFSSNLLEAQTNRVYMPNIEHKTLYDVVNYAYSGSISLNVNNVQSVFQLASLFQVKDLYNACCVFMESKLDLANCLDVYRFGKQHMCEHLTTKSTEFVARHINELVKSREFIELDDIELVAHVLACDELEVASEEIVVEALLAWLRHDPTARIAHLERLFTSTVRLGLCDMDYLKKLTQNNDDESVTRSLGRLVAKRLENIECDLEDKPRAGMAKAQQCFLLVGGLPDSSNSHDQDAYVNCFNPFNGEKYYFATSFLEKPSYNGKGYFHVEYPGVCVTQDNRVFVAGGLYVFHKSRSPRKPSSNTPRKLNSSSSRLLPDETTNDEENQSTQDLQDGEEVLSKEMYEYDGKTCTWTKRANMLFAKANLSLCAMNDRIYSFGGVSSGQIPLDIVEYYDINENKWVYVGSMPTPFVAGSVVAHEDKFYVLGGRNGVGRHDCCYIFKPYKAQWIEINKLNIGRFNFGACVIDGYLYAFGGQRYSESEEHYFTREALDSVEMLDLHGDHANAEWTFAPKMPASLYNTGCFVPIEVADTASQSNNKPPSSVYLCGTTECQYSGSTLFGFMFTSVFRLDFTHDLNNRTRLKWTIVEHDVSEVKAYYRCVGARVNTRKLTKFATDIRPTTTTQTNTNSLSE